MEHSLIASYFYTSCLLSSLNNIKRYSPFPFSFIHQFIPSTNTSCSQREIGYSKSETWWCVVDLFNAILNIFPFMAHPWIAQLLKERGFPLGFSARPIVYLVFLLPAVLACEWEPSSQRLIVGLHSIGSFYFSHIFFSFSDPLYVIQLLLHSSNLQTQDQVNRC